MSEIAISVKNLGKKYRIGYREPYKTITETLTRKVKDGLFGQLGGHSPQSLEQSTFWALENVSFDVYKGDVLGIIGRNGAGKSTLLKILSRITAPSQGRAEVHGRVGSLLEVGTGFHPELTGRENIYLNGSILGLKKQEIEQKFDDIIKFSEIEKFLDTPVKRYSSGMYVRLAFAIAAHLEPEILIIDEVLAVGDAHFQKKCLGKMGEVAKEGWTVLFVSHNMNAVEQLCSKCLSLDNGKIKEYASDVRGVINDYLFNEKDNARKCEWVNSGNEYPNPWFQPLKFSLTDENGKTIDSAVNNNDEIFINIKGKIEQVDPYLTIGYAIYSNDGNLLYWSYQTDSAEQDWHELKRGINILKSCIPKKFLNEGSYRIELIGGLHFREWLFQPGHTIPVIFLTIQGGLSDSPYWIIKRPGLLAPVIGWGVEYENV